MSNIRIGREASEAGEFDPAIDSRAPFLNAFCRIVLSPSLDFESPISSLMSEVDAIYGASQSTFQARTISSVG